MNQIVLFLLSAAISAGVSIALLIFAFILKNLLRRSFKTSIFSSSQGTIYGVQKERDYNPTDSVHLLVDQPQRHLTDNKGPESSYLNNAELSGIDEDIPTSSVEEWFPAKKSYTPISSDEVLIIQGDMIQVKMIFNDGMAFGVNKTLDMRGRFPINCVRDDMGDDQDEFFTIPTTPTQKHIEHQNIVSNNLDKTEKLRESSEPQSHVIATNVSQEEAMEIVMKDLTDESKKQYFAQLFQEHELRRKSSSSTLVLRDDDNHDGEMNETLKRESFEAKMRWGALKRNWRDVLMQDPGLQPDKSKWTYIFKELKHGSSRPDLYESNNEVSVDRTTLSQYSS